MSAPHPACVPDDKLLEQCAVSRLRRSGPGGQHRNKVETAVRLVHNPTGIVSEASERRSQEENRRIALERLRRNLAVKVRLPLERSAPSSKWSERCRDGKVLISADHSDFACLLAEVLDVLQHFQWDLREAAGFLGCTPSQLTKFVRKEPTAFSAVNSSRRQQGLKLLR